MFRSGALWRNNNNADALVAWDNIAIRQRAELHDDRSRRTIDHGASICASGRMPGIGHNAATHSQDGAETEEIRVVNSRHERLVSRPRI